MGVVGRVRLGLRRRALPQLRPSRPKEVRKVAVVGTVVKRMKRKPVLRRRLRLLLPRLLIPLLLLRLWRRRRSRKMALRRRKAGKRIASPIGLKRRKKVLQMAAMLERRERMRDRNGV